MDWEVAKWAKTRGTGSTAFSDLLAVDGVYKALGLSYCNSAELNHIIDTEIPARRPAFTRKEVVIGGEAFDLYKRPIEDCIRALYGSPDHARYLCVSPERHYSDANKTQRLYHDMHTGKWWWNTQVQLEQDKPGATIVPVIISSDKTQITLFRNKSAYPVYLTIGNLPKEVRRKPSQQAQILLAYLPTTRLQHLPTKAARRRAVSNLFHACMGSILAPLKSAGIDGIIMTSGDGVRRRCHPILAAYIGDYPEQMLVSCGYYGRSPICMVAKHELGEYPCTAEYRDAIQAIEVAHLIGTDEWAQSCAAANMKPVQHPFWEDLPYTDIFCSITPDLLHQLYQGVMKHLIKWITAIVGAGEVDARVRRLPAKHGMRHFHKGITTLSRVSGTEHKQMCMFLLSLVIDVPRLAPAKSRRLITATRSLLDFLYMSSFPIHSDESLTSVDAALALFHENKDIFIELGAREHFNIPKIHFLCHYVRAFKLFGTSDNYNTEATERLHIDFAKDAYRASNRKDEYSQMTKWLERQEKVNHHASYIAWQQSQPQLDIPSPTTISGVRYDFPGSQKTLHDMQCPLTQHFAKFPTVKTVSISKLEERSLLGYGATQFEYALKRFISQFRNPEFTPAEVNEMASFLSLPFRGVPVWHRMKFRNEDLYGKKTLDVVSAHPRRLNAQGQVRQTSQFDAALIRVQKDDDNGKYVLCSVVPARSLMHSISGCQIGRVRAIFSLPKQHLNRLFPANVTPPVHLAYVEWFTKFTQRPEPYSLLYHVKPQFCRDGSRAVSVVPVDMIKQSVCLYPRWGGTAPPQWTHESVLDQCPSFYLSPFTDIHMYFNLS
ncbi:uncharacterized protein C8R40DRAFT_1150820 [Lentinula edodes]|uniref:uncharacterized protein n=1 Tax=Lentinula edodes TaxID=5353 RepID=UPI001E8CAF36|nr:uncharacterized protein C8R40DRAFT_1150820 [Lentinula edodes]KAH7872867.1 hypothetical protein C8R40DRAFT_1150820 [Lentinula edodes]